MTLQSPSDLGSFYLFIGEQLGNGGANLTPEECLELWRSEQSTPVEHDATIAALRRALEQVERGEGQSLDSFDSRFRERHGLGAEV